MGGTLEVTEELCWMPPGWLYNAALGQMASAVQGTNPELAATLRNAEAFGGTAYLDLRGYDLEAFRKVSDAARAALDSTVRGGPASMHSPEYFPAFVDGLRELCEMLERGLRDRENSS